MIAEDTHNVGVNNAYAVAVSQDYIRVLPTIAPGFTNPKSLAYKSEFASTVADLAQPQDDPVYLELHEKYIGAILFDNETRASHKLFRVASTQFVRSFSTNRPNCWEATCEPVFFCTGSGAFLVPQDKRVEGSNVIIATALVGYALTEYPNGMDSEPAHLPWVDNYIAHYKNEVEPSCSLASLPAASTPLQPTRPCRRSRIQSSRDAEFQ
jgi:hypothetical protein